MKTLTTVTIIALCISNTAQAKQLPNLKCVQKTGAYVLFDSTKETDDEFAIHTFTKSNAEQTPIYIIDGEGFRVLNNTEKEHEGNFILSDGMEFNYHSGDSYVSRKNERTLFSWMFFEDYSRAIRTTFAINSDSTSGATLDTYYCEPTDMTYWGLKERYP
ncbi:hypothetical protein ACPV4A_01235 [Vibrio rotiferianus]|uniref:hypothetical protein n=1 Tax=Vibrio rotiferianus TaxID=190895 RepID=UPI00406A4D3E